MFTSSHHLSLKRSESIKGTCDRHSAQVCGVVRVQFQGPAAPGLRARGVLGPGRLGRVDQRGLGPSGAAPQRGPADACALEHHGKPHAAVQSPSNTLTCDDS